MLTVSTLVLLRREIKECGSTTSGPGEKNSPGEPKGLAIDHLCCRTADILFECCSDAEEDKRELVEPVAGVELCFEGCLHLSMKALDKSVSLGVIGCSVCGVDAEHGEEVRPEV